MRTDRRFVYLLSVAHRRVGAWVGAHSDATPAQAGVLFAIGEAGGVLLGDVAHALGMGAPGASGLVDRMVLARLVERRPDPDDGRATRLYLTRRGQAMRLAARTGVAEINARLTAGFSDAELAIVARWLTHVGTAFAKEPSP